MDAGGAAAVLGRPQGAEKAYEDAFEEAKGGTRHVVDDVGQRLGPPHRAVLETRSRGVLPHVERAIDEVADCVEASWRKRCKDAGGQGRPMELRRRSERRSRQGGRRGAARP